MGKCVLMSNRDVFKQYLTGKKPVHFSQEMKMHFVKTSYITVRFHQSKWYLESKIKYHFLKPRKDILKKIIHLKETFFISSVSSSTSRHLEDIKWVTAYGVGF